jgi:hypothetical protein
MSTNVFWAGTVSGKKVVSIFNNPTGQTGSNTPLNNPLNSLDRIYFDTRFEYFNILWKTNFVQSYSNIEVNTDENNKKGKSAPNFPNHGTNIYTIANHNFGFVPCAILLDSDTNEIIGANTFVQNLNNNSFRLATLMMDSTKFYIKENYFVRLEPLSYVTKRYTILAFNNIANVPTI